MSVKIQFSKIYDLPIAIIDDFYGPNEFNEILNEITFFTDYMGDPSFTGSAFEEIDGIKEYLKKNNGLFLDEVFRDRNLSKILKHNRNLFDENLLKILVENHIFFKYILKSTKDTTLIQYYENKDYYKFHDDSATVTCISWLHKTPKKFSGGDLLFKDGTTIECLNNRMLIFPSILDHRVENVFLSDEYSNMNFGRYSITQFIYL